MPTPTSAVKVNPVTGALIDPPVATFAAANGLLTTGSSDAKNSVRAATTANGTLATAFANGQTVDGIALVTSDRILLKNQTAQAENGIYTVNASGAPTRATDFDAWDEIIGAFVTVESGTVNAGTQWLCNVVAGGTLGTTAITFVVPKNFVDLTTTQTISGAKAFTSTSSTYSGLTIRNSPGFLVDSCYLSIGGTGTNISFFSSFTTTGAIEFVGSYNSTFTLTGTTALTFPTSGTILSSTNIGVSVQAYDADLTTWAGITPGANVGTFLATPSGANLASALTSALPESKGGTAFTSMVKFHAYKTADQTTTGGSYEQITFPSEDFDTGSNFASNAFTAPVAGKYIFGASLYCATGSRIINVALYKNGTQIKRLAGSGGTRNGDIFTGTVTVSLAANDVMTIYSYTDGATTYTGAQSIAYFWGALLPGS